MANLDPGTIRDVMNDARQKSKDPAEGFVLGVSIVLGGAVAIRIFSSFFGEELGIRSIWTYIEGAAAVYASCFLILLIFFASGPKRSAKLAALPAISALWPLALALALILYSVLMVVGFLIFILVKASGKKDFAWGTGSLVDMFTLKWWKSKGWRPPPRPNIKNGNFPAS
jgi:hypothetical protein